MKAAPEEHFEFCERPAVDTLTLLKFRKWPFPQLSSLHPPVFALYWGRRASSDRPQCKQIKPPLSVYNKCIKDTKYCIVKCKWKLSPCLACKVPKPQPTPPRNDPRKFLQAYIFPRKILNIINIRIELIGICTMTYRRDSCMKGLGKC